MKFKKNIPLAPYTSFKIGGPAQYFYTAQTKKEIIKAVQQALKNNIDFLILGRGSNVLISDQGFKSLVIKLENKKINFKDSENYKIIQAEAGADLQNLVNLSLKNGLAGLEWAGGIPGSLGGAIRGNAGAFGSSIRDVVQKVEALKIIKSKLSIQSLSGADCRFSYRSSIFKNKNYIILSADLKLKKDDPQKIQEKIKKYLDYRRKNHPLKYPSAGSIFKNITLSLQQINQKIKKNSSFTQQEKTQILQKMKSFIKSLGFIPAGWLIEKSKANGLCVKDACISPKHNNFIINQGQAKAQDVLKLIELVQKKVYNKFKLKLEPEIQFIG